MWQKLASMQGQTNPGPLSDVQSKRVSCGAQAWRRRAWAPASARSREARSTARRTASRWSNRRAWTVTGALMRIAAQCTLLGGDRTCWPGTCSVPLRIATRGLPAGAGSAIWPSGPASSTSARHGGGAVASGHFELDWLIHSRLGPIGAAACATAREACQLGPAIVSAAVTWGGRVIPVHIGAGAPSATA